MSAKKKSGRKAAGSNRAPRKQSICMADISRASKLLADQSAQLAALAQQMSELALDEIEIDGVGLLERGVGEIDRYVDNILKGIAKGRREKERAAL